MDIQIKIQNLDQLKSAFLKSPQTAIREYSTAIEKTILSIEQNAKRNAPVNKQSSGGNLRQSISSRMRGTLTGIVQAKAKYAGFVDKGTRPHIIRVRSKKVLANKRAGQIFGRVVRHPGTRANPFFTNAVKDNTSFMNKQLKIAMQNTLNSIR